MATVQAFQKRHLPAITPADFFILLSEATGKDKVFLLAHPEYELTTNEELRLESFLVRRLKREPVAYITGHKEFYGRDFSVNEATLIPRPETELLVERILEDIRSEGPAETDILDIGTGSGNIIITLAAEISRLVPHGRCFNFSAIDISCDALLLARKNAALHGLSSHIAFIESDLLKSFPFPPKKNRHVIIAANLPYLSSAIYDASEPDVRNYEPEGALKSGTAGLDHYLRLLKELEAFSQHYHSTTLFLEISPEQSVLLKGKILELFPHSMPTVFQDLSSKDRLIRASF